MSCHLSHRLTSVHRAISMALLCSLGYVASATSAQAATIGKTMVASAQHEPLVASIMVTEIQAADFSASLANPAIYQQMGLTQTDSMRVHFTPTSATSGQVLITTSKPVSKPFADVVLAINDKGQRNVIPKTLLMPLNDSLPIDTSKNLDRAKNIVTGAKKPNLPSVSASTVQPLTVRRGAPPPLISSSNQSQPQSSTNELIVSKAPAPAIQAPTLSTSQGNNLAYAPNRLDNGRLDDGRLNEGRATSANNSSNDTAAAASNMSNDNMQNNNRANDIAATSNKPLVTVNETQAPAIVDKQLDILNIQVTRQVQPSGQKDVSTVAASPMVPAPNNQSTDTLPPHLNTNNAIATTSTGNILANMAASEVPKAMENANVSSSAITSNMTASSAMAQYQVQRNDSLWLIAQQIAQENNLDIPTVMKQIQSQNPDAFINKDADQLKADAKLNLPSYDVIPSQRKLEAAISAQRQYIRRADTVTTKAVKTPTKTSSEPARSAKTRETPTVTKTQILPKAQFSVLAPDHNGSAEGTQARLAATKGNGLSTDILATLKSSRQNTATQAQQLSKTSSALDSYSKKIQLQNQKLAELQARLKKLRNQ